MTDVKVLDQYQEWSKDEVVKLLDSNPAYKEAGEGMVICGVAIKDFTHAELLLVCGFLIIERSPGGSLLEIEEGDGTDHSG